MGTTKSAQLVGSISLTEQITLEEARDALEAWETDEEAINYDFGFTPEHARRVLALETQSYESPQVPFHSPLADDEEVVAWAYVTPPKENIS